MDLLFLKTGMRLNRDRNTQKQNLPAARDPDGFKVSFNLDFLGKAWLWVHLMPSASPSVRGEGFERTTAKSRDFHSPGGLGTVGLGNGSVQTWEDEGNVPGRLPQSRGCCPHPKSQLCSTSPAPALPFF